MMSVARAEHWDAVYGGREVESASWYRPRLQTSLELIDASGLGPGAALIDVGGGASTLVDDLLARGYRHLTVLDVSARAIEAARRRLGDRATGVHWIVADITEAQLPESGYGLWHDRATFHFLLAEADRAAYVARLRRALAPDGQAILATFAPDGPERCSGLPVARHRPEDLLAAVGPGFRLAESRRQVHVTPSGAEQTFTWVRLARDGRPSAT